MFRYHSTLTQICLALLTFFSNTVYWLLAMGWLFGPPCTVCVVACIFSAPARPFFVTELLDIFSYWV